MTVNVQVVVDRGEGPRSLNDSLKIPSETGFGYNAFFSHYWCECVLENQSYL